MVARSSCVSPCSTFRLAGESCGVSRGVNWLTPGTEENINVVQLTTQLLEGQNEYYAGKSTHCGRARGQARPCRVSPTPRGSSRGLKRNVKLKSISMLARLLTIFCPKGLFAIHAPCRSSSCSSWPLFWLSTVVFSAGTVSFEISDEFSSDAIAQTTKI